MTPMTYIFISHKRETCSVCELARSGRDVDRDPVSPGGMQNLLHAAVTRRQNFKTANRPEVAVRYGKVGGCSQLLFQTKRRCPRRRVQIRGHIRQHPLHCSHDPSMERSNIDWLSAKRPSVCIRKSTKLHVQLRITTPDAWLVIADHAFTGERRSSEAPTASCSVSGLESPPSKLMPIALALHQDDLHTRSKDKTLPVMTVFGPELSWTPLGI